MDARVAASPALLSVCPSVSLLTPGLFSSVFLISPSLSPTVSLSEEAWESGERVS